MCQLMRSFLGEFSVEPLQNHSKKRRMLEKEEEEVGEVEGEDQQLKYLHLQQLQLQHCPQVS